MTTRTMTAAGPRIRSSKQEGPAAAAVLTPGQIIDVPYALWLATLAGALMATIALTVVVGIYLLDTAMSLSGSVPAFGPETYFRVFELVALFGAVAVVTHFLRLRLEAIRRASIMVPLPSRVVASPPGGDTFSKFECSCQVTLALDHERPLAELKLKSDMLQTYLENAFAVAITDPVIRYSKLKMEQTLKIAALHVLGEGVSGVIISEVRQRRVPNRPMPQPANSEVVQAAAV